MRKSNLQWLFSKPYNCIEFTNMIKKLTHLIEHEGLPFGL